MSEADDTSDHWADGVYWSYLGQATFTTNPVPYGMMTIAREPEQVGSRSLSDKILGTIRIDAMGRRWVAIDLDEAVVMARLEARRTRERADFGHEPNYPTNDEEEAYTEGSGEHQFEFYLPHSWSWSTCNGEPRALGVWNAESRVNMTGAFTAAQSKSVVLFFDNTPICNGTVVDSDVVLTAGHCLVDSNGNDLQADNLRACTRGNSQGGAVCQLGDLVTLGPDFNPSVINPAHDYALLHLTGGLGVGYMALSSASNTVIQSNPIHRVAYPLYNPQTPWSPCSFDPMQQAQVTPPNVGARVFRQTGDIPSTPANRVCSRHDSSVGESGSGFYYFTSGCGTSSCSGAHYLVGLVAGASTCDLNPFTWFIGGPKARDIKDWVDSQL